MQLFTNKFTAAVNQNKTEVLLNFFQDIPVIPDGAAEITLSMDMKSNFTPVANLVMTGQSAQNLAKLLQSLMEQNIPPE